MSPHPLDHQYAETVYAGVLGKIIGVYAGRPFEGWSHEKILERLGPIDRYVADELGVPLVVTDDDISGTFTFLRALADTGDNANLTAEQIGECWQNYIIEGRSVLWWGGMGMSTEHTAFLRLQAGIPAPRSGSIELNGKTVAEQIGAQIFIDGWGLICPGDPDQAASFAQRAGSVSHDGEAVFAAQVVAALVAQAFVEKDVARLLDVALQQIPTDCTIAQVIHDIRSWHSSGMDWVRAFHLLKEKHGYDRYPSNCHVIPNHGVVILALLFGGGNFSKSLLIANTCGWDTDCNSANVCCILGVIGGLSGIEADTDWRGPVRDQIYLPTADGGRCVSDAVLESVEIVRMARALRGEETSEWTWSPRFSFRYPGSVQGFCADGAELDNPSGRLNVCLTAQTATVLTATIPPKDLRDSTFYSAMFSPTLYPGQVVRAVVHCAGPVSVRIRAEIPHADNQEANVCSDWTQCAPSVDQELEFEIPNFAGACISRIGIEVAGSLGDQLELLSLTWNGVPTVVVQPTDGDLSSSCWVNGLSEFAERQGAFSMIQNRGTGLAIYGCREWDDYEVSVDLTVYLAETAGIACRVQGMKRFYALIVTSSGRLRLMRGGFPDRILADCPFSYLPDDTIALRLEVKGNRLVGTANGTIKIEATDTESALSSGAVGLVLKDGRCGFKTLSIRPCGGER